MLKYIFSIFCVCPLLLNAQIVPASASYDVSVQEQVENRWRAFHSNREFILFTPGKSDAVLKQEFENIHSVRTFLWTTSGFERAQHLLSADLVRAPGCAAFAYNNTVPYYNASTMCLGQKHYIACEGPRSKDIPHFFNLLKTHRVTHLVRLTDSYEGASKKCHPYWEGLLSNSNGKTYLNVPTEASVYPVRAFTMAHWRDHEGVDPEELLNLVLQVREEVEDRDGLLLVHCSAGVGRTGTFLAALAIVDAIDRGTSFSIEEIVYQLSLQRVHSVGKYGQYITLHRLAEHYLKRSATTAHSVTFRSKAELEKALEPLSIEKVIDYISNSTALVALDLRCDEAVSVEKNVRFRNPDIGDLLKTEVYKTNTLTVFYPETPRVPHHLAIALNRPEVNGIAGVTPEENDELFATIKKIAEIYKTVNIQGFVIAQFDTPQQGHMGRYVVEVIPHLPGFNAVKNAVDKADCNRHVLFRTANLSPIAYTIEPDEIQKQALFWQIAFQKEQSPLQLSDTSFPYTRKESHVLEAERILCHQLLEILQDKGGHVAEDCPFTPVMPVEASDVIKSLTSATCVFCDTAVIERQLVYEYQDVYVLYNFRKESKAGSSFLILPKRHTEKVYGLEPNKIATIGIVRKALVEVLKEIHPECNVIMYIQDDPAIGQTVFHSHEQIVAIDPKTIALTWTMRTLFFLHEKVTDEEMYKIRKEVGLKLEQKIKEILAIPCGYNSMAAG